MSHSVLSVVVLGVVVWQGALVPLAEHCQPQVLSAALSEALLWPVSPRFCLEDWNPHPLHSDIHTSSWSILGRKWSAVVTHTSDPVGQCAC